MCIAMVSSVSSGCSRTASANGTTWSTGTPNLIPPCPVAMKGWVSAVTSGFTRIPTWTPLPTRATIRPSAASSAVDSRCTWPMPASTAAVSSSSVLPTPLNTMRSGSNPAASARASSPPDTMSAPAPRSRRIRSTARFALALTA